ncbi:hypothetical protein EDB83DRAFT_2682298 [Lactarius deliciosus]|nr:hypothetical protein EDB83DRAFT_2682298 [Lactarius deliciosus]
MARTDFPVSPSFPRISEIFPSVPIYHPAPSTRISFQTHPPAPATQLTGSPNGAVGTPDSSNPALIRLGARRGCPSLPASRSASAQLPNSRSTVRSSCQPTTLALRPLQRRTASPRRARSRTSRCSTLSACLPAAHDVPPIAVFGHGLVAALIPGRPLRRVTLRIASTLYNCARRTCLARLAARLRSSDLYSPGVDVRTRGRPLGAGLEVSLQARLEALYKDRLLPSVQALRMPRLRATLATEAAKSEEGPSRLTL